MLTDTTLVVSVILLLYVCRMSKQSNGAPAQGAAAPLLSPDSVKAYLEKDLAIMANLIHALRDPDVCAYLAEYLSNRYHATKHNDAPAV